MKANYGYKDGAGDFFITVDTDKCDGCGKCVPVCPAQVMEVGEDQNDPLNENMVARVSNQQRKKLKYACAPCKPGHDRKTEPCRAACPKDALAHSW
jgi:NAD-dependent dihydropyrimidine dehydrogenase PreA subunit